MENLINCSKVLYDAGNVVIHLVEECDEDVRNEREKYYITNFPCVNKCAPIVNKEDKLQRKKDYYEKTKEHHSIQSKEYREKNREFVLERKRDYYAKNKEKINIVQAEKITCECGSIVRKSDIAKHKKSKKHLHRSQSLTIQI